MEFIFVIFILIMSVVLHELAHGYSALMLGDNTAKYQGRLTLNPIKHLDPIGSIFLPLMLFILQTGVIFGWAKPVPYNPYNLRNKKWGEAIVASAGPLTNILLAVSFGLVIRIGESFGIASSFLELCGVVVFINIVLAVFNLIPIPPLDGSKVLFSILPLRFEEWRYKLERYGLLILLFFLLFLWEYVFPLILWIFHFIIGTNIGILSF